MVIESRQNRAFKDIRRLRQSKGDLALLEGPHLVEEALRDGVSLESVLATREFLDSPAGGRLAALLARPPLEIKPSLLDELCDADAPRGLLAVARLPRGDVTTLPLVAGGVYLYLEGAQDPGNLGAAIRSLEAAGGVAAALSPGSASPNHARALRGSAGSLLRMPVAVRVEAGELDEHLTPARPRWLALVPRDGIDPATADLSGTLVLAVGAEGPGLSEELASRAEVRLTIPLAGAVESLNLAVATALVLFEARRRRASTDG
jgi:RNA methyltransferase, TrmH family